MSEFNRNAFIFDRPTYFDTPFGRLRLLEADEETFVGSRFGKIYKIPLSQTTSARTFD